MPINQLYNIILALSLVDCLLMEWRSYSSESGDKRIANKYEDILYDFVGAWESWLMSIEPKSIESGDIEKYYSAFITHLKLTASTTISALRFNNYEAAGWGIDMLNNWIHNFTFDDFRHEEYSWRSILLNHYYLLKNTDDPAWQFILNGHFYNQLAATNLAFKNASFDLRVLTACYILLKPEQGQQDILSLYVKALLSGSPIHNTGRFSGIQYFISNAADLLGVYIRHRDYHHNGEHYYGGWLSSILESFGRIYEERRVSGRIYSGWGASDPRDMNKAYVEIAIYYSETTWGLSSEWEEAIFSDAFRHMDRESIVSDLREWIAIAQVECTYTLITAENRSRLIANFITSITAIIQQIENSQVQRVIESEIDPDRLNLIGVASSQNLKNFETPNFPLSLFETINSSDEIDENEPYEINISGYTKERLARGIETNRSINENEWLAGYISGDVQINVLKKLIDYPVSESYRFEQIDNVLSEIKVLSNSMACPVLFVGNQELTKTLRRSSFDRNIADQHEISRSDGFDKEYICHIGRCEAYKLSFTGIDYCLLTSKELFYKIDLF